MTPVPIRDVTIEDEFWSPKFAVWRATTINDVFDKFEAHGGLRNFDRVAARQTGGHQGEPWWDGLIYETITASADLLAERPDAALQKRVTGYVERIAAAADADPDGYVNTDCTLNHVGIRWSNPPTPGDTHNDVYPHTVYNAGCLVEAGVHLYRATGQIQLLKVATRLANYMCGVMGPPPRQNIIPGHAISEWSFVELYKLYHEQPDLKEKVGLPVAEGDYLKLAEFWIENRGHVQGRVSSGVYNQDNVSVFQQPTLEGHAVRSTLLATGMAAAAGINNRGDYLAATTRWWENMVRAKMYLTGGLGSVPKDESFGPDYVLPNQGYAETCAAGAGGFFSHNMNLLTGDAKYADVLERELYNGALGGVSLAGNTYFYTNFLNAGPDHRRWEWMGSSVTGTPCCPPMFLKLQSALPGYLYATDASGIYVNLYVGSKAQMTIGRSHVTLQQTTRYPWEGTVNIAVTPPEPEKFALNLRMPGWAEEASVEVNGVAVSPEVSNHYLRLDRTWKAGDVVTLRLPMPVERIKADPKVVADVGRMALMRGPIVYCLEGIDNGGRVSSLRIPPATPIVPEERSDLLGGVVVLRGEAVRLREEDGTTQTEPVKFTAIPFYANSNRQPTDMAVWVADDPAHVQPVTLAGDAEPSASYSNPNDSLHAINDGVEPARSDDESIPRMTWWNHRGTSEWAQLTFEKPRRCSGVDVYWWDERRLSGRDCRVPQSWTLQYLDGGEWKPVLTNGEFGTQIDQYNHVDFPPVTTTALRVVVQLQDGRSGGILEWRVNDGGPAVRSTMR